MSAIVFSVAECPPDYPHGFQCLRLFFNTFLTLLQAQGPPEVSSTVRTAFSFRGADEARGGQFQSNQGTEGAGGWILVQELEFHLRFALKVLGLS